MNSYLMELNPELVLNATKGAIIKACLRFGDDDVLKEKVTLKAVNDEFSMMWKEEIKEITAELDNPKSEFNTRMTAYKNFKVKFDKLPELIKEAFDPDKVFIAIEDKDDVDLCFEEDCSYEWTEKLSTYIYENTWTDIIRRRGFDGPDDSAILSCHLNFYDNTFTMNGKIRFCIYAMDDSFKDFKILIKELNSYKDGKLSFEDVYQAEDTYGISMDAIQNDDTTRWLTVEYEYKTKLA